MATSCTPAPSGVLGALLSAVSVSKESRKVRLTQSLFSLLTLHAGKEYKQHFLLKHRESLALPLPSLLQF